MHGIDKNNVSKMMEKLDDTDDSLPWAILNEGMSIFIPYGILPIVTCTSETEASHRIETRACLIRFLVTLKSHPEVCV